jgi:hypothetical protein
MKREEFVKVAEETLDSLPEEFRSPIQNVAILVEDFPPNQPRPKLGQRRRLLLGIFHGVPATKKSVFDLSVGLAKSHFTRKTLRRSARMRLKSDIKSARLSYMNWGIIWDDRGATEGCVVASVSDVLSSLKIRERSKP